MKIAFLGLGSMGQPMAGRLLDAGHEVVVWNRTASRATGLGARGAVVAASPAEAARASELTITMLADENALEQVLFGRDGAATAMGPGSVLIDMSTVGPTAIARVRERLADVDIVDAPVLGSTAAAARGELVVLVGATSDRWHGLLSTFGRVVPVGGPGSAAAMKLIVNSTLLAATSALGEALALGDASGIARATVLDILEMGLFAPIVRYKRPLIDAGSYDDAAFSLGLAAKDARLVAEEAEAAGVNLRIAPAVRAWFDDAAAGRATEDFAAVVAHIEEAAARG